jgi:hypothetical protein
VERLGERKGKKTENEVNKLQSIIFRFDAFFLLLYADRIVENLGKERKFILFDKKHVFDVAFCYN